MDRPGRVPRARVLHEAWGGLAGVESWTGPHGAPLSRVTKLVLIPLVLRPLSNPALAGDLLDPDGVTQLHAAVGDARRSLAAAVTWYDVLKATRRRLGIVTGNPQDRYLQRAYELAVAHGAPHPDTAPAMAETLLLELEADSAGRTVDELTRLLADTARRDTWTRQLAAAWRERQDAPRTTPPSDEVRRLLDALPSPQLRMDADRLLTTWAAARFGGAWGARLWAADPEEAPRGLTSALPAAAPELGDGVRTADLPPPLDRSVHQRVFSALRASSQRDLLPPVAQMIDAEITRSCSPLGLDAEAERVVLLIGSAAADALDVDDSPAPSAAHRQLRRQWERERIVARSRRLTSGAHQAGQATPPALYVRRLWARVHGRDVRQAEPLDAHGTWDLLDGVCRSVILDQRAQVRRVLRSGADAMEQSA